MSQYQLGMLDGVTIIAVPLLGLWLGRFIRAMARHDRLRRSIAGRLGA